MNVSKRMFFCLGCCYIQYGSYKSTSNTTEIMLLLVVLILTLLQVSLSTTFLLEQFKNAIENQKQFFVSCPGSVIIIDEIFDTHYYQEIINEFMQIYNFPIVVISKNDVSINRSLKLSEK